MEKLIDPTKLLWVYIAAVQTGDDADTGRKFSTRNC
jgi:hypothetical protein